MTWLVDSLTRIFGPDGWLVQRGGHYLPEQLDYALSVANWLQGAPSQPVALIEGETGTGKSLGYLFPITLHWVKTKSKSVVATQTIALQRQLLNGDLLIIEEYLHEHGLPVPRCAQRLGMAHFVDPNRVRHLLNENPDNHDLALFYEWAASSSKTGSGLIDDWTELHGPLPDGVRADHICVTPSSEEGVNIAYENHKIASKTADIVLTSHMMVLLEAKSGQALLDLGGDVFENLVFDEADTLPASAEQLSNRRTQPLEVARELERLIGLGSSNLDKHLIASVREIRRINGEMSQLGFQATTSEVVLDRPSKSQDRVAQLVQQLQQECLRIDGVLQRSTLHRSPKHFGRVSDVRNLLNWVATFSHNEKKAQYGLHALSWSPIRKIPSLMYQQANPGFFVSNLWRNMGLRVCMTSATLGTASSDRIAEPFIGLKANLAIGRDTVFCEKQFAPRSFGDVRFVLADSHVPKPVLTESGDEVVAINPAWLSYAISMIREAMTAGLTLVLANSYSEAEMIGSRLAGNQSVMVHRRGESLNDAIDAFRSGRAAALITPAAWQGISIRDDHGKQLFDQLVITRIPFMPPDSARERLAIEIATEFGQRSPSEARRYEALNRRLSALIKLRQGVGRLIRSRNDAGVIWLADPRFPHPGQASPNQLFVRAIPSRFAPAYEDARVYLKTGEYRSAKADIPKEIQEFFE